METILSTEKAIRNGNDKYFPIKLIFLLSKLNKKSFTYTEVTYKIPKFKAMVNLNGPTADIISVTS